MATTAARLLLAACALASSAAGTPGTPPPAVNGGEALYRVTTGVSSEWTAAAVPILSAHSPDDEDVALGLKLEPLPSAPAASYKNLYGAADTVVSGPAAGEKAHSSAPAPVPQRAGFVGARVWSPAKPPSSAAASSSSAKAATRAPPAAAVLPEPVLSPWATPEVTDPEEAAAPRTFAPLPPPRGSRAAAPAAQAPAAPTAPAPAVVPEVVGQDKDSAARGARKVPPASEAAGGKGRLLRSLKVGSNTGTGNGNKAPLFSALSMSVGGAAGGVTAALVAAGGLAVYGAVARYLHHRVEQSRATDAAFIASLEGRLAAQQTEAQRRGGHEQSRASLLQELADAKRALQMARTGAAMRGRNADPGDVASVRKELEQRHFEVVSSMRSALKAAQAGAGKHEAAAEAAEARAERAERAASAAAAVGEHAVDPADVAALERQLGAAKTAAQAQAQRIERAERALEAANARAGDAASAKATNAALRTELDALGVQAAEAEQALRLKDEQHLRDVSKLRSDLGSALEHAQRGLRDELDEARAALKPGKRGRKAGGKMPELQGAGGGSSSYRR